MKTNMLLPLLAAGIFGVATANAQYVFTNWDGDNLWNNPDNWNQDTPPGAADTAWINYFDPDDTNPYFALINTDVGSISEAVIGQGTGPGSVQMIDGAISTSHINLGWGGGLDGSWIHEGGVLTARNLRIVRGDGGTGLVDISGGTVNSEHIRVNWEGTAGFVGNGILNVSGGTLQTSGTHDMLIGRGDNNGTAGVNISGTGSVIINRNVDMNLTGSGGTADSSLNVSGGSLAIGGRLAIAHQGGDADVEMTGGEVTIDGQLRIGNVDTASTATGSLNVTGGSFTVKALTAVGTVGDGMGRGSITIGGDAEFTFGESNASIVLRAGENSFTVIGSNATINSLRAAGTALEFNNGNDVNFVFDAGGISAVNMLADIRFGGGDVTLNIDAEEAGPGLYTLFTFNDYWATGFTEFGDVNVTLADEGWTWDVHYNAQDIQFEVIPEPGAYAMIFGGLALLGAFVYRRLIAKRV